MRDPNNMNSIDEYIERNTIIKIDTLPEFITQDYDLLDEKDFKKYMNDLENLIRHSPEYKRMVAYLKENVDMNKCAFYENVSNLDSRKIKIEIHHDPFSLYDICIIVYNKRNANKEPLDIELVAKEVMILHYNMLVGLIPLAETVHELVHNQYLFVPTDKVFGQYKKFRDMYQDYMLPEQIDNLERIEEASKFANDNYKTILGANYIYLDLSGVYKLPQKEMVIEMMRDRIKEIRDDKKKPMLIRPITKL